MCRQRGGLLGGLKVPESAMRWGSLPGENGSGAAAAVGDLPRHSAM